MVDFLIIVVVLMAVAIAIIVSFLVKLSSFAVEIADKVKDLESISGRMERMEEDTSLVYPILRKLEASGVIQKSLVDVPQAGSYDPTRFNALSDK